MNRIRTPLIILCFVMGIPCLGYGLYSAAATVTCTGCDPFLIGLWVGLMAMLIGLLFVLSGIRFWMGRSKR